MAKMIPSYIDKKDSRRGGERMVFEWLSGEKIPGIVYYSLNQINHKHKLIGEVDFLCVCERGFLCIEVKGGQQIYCNDKQWYSKSKSNRINEISNPFLQAKDCMYALKNYFKEIYGHNSLQAKYLMGYAVIFPECKFTGSGNDLISEIVFDARYDLEDFPKYINKTFDYWEAQEKDKHNFNPAKLNVLQFNQINDLLRGDFCVVPSLSLELQHIEQKMIRLTEEQFEALDVTDDNKRVIIQGGAGTGKSLLALEKVRKCAAKEKRVLYVCFNRNMSRYALSSLAGCNMEYIKVSTFHALLQSYLEQKVFSKTVKEASEIFTNNILDIQKFDYIVIDEGQDLMNIWALDALEHFLVGGLSKGSWVIFLDQNQSIFTKSEEYDFAFEFICETTKPTILRLNMNCRNTEQIARRTSVLTLIPSAKHLSVSGPKVISKSYENNNELIKGIRKELQSLFTGGISPIDVVILSPKKICNSLLSSVGSMCNLDIVERNNIEDMGKTCINYFTVQAFKGLESKVIIYIDVDGFISDNNRILNYVALSRAKQLLYVFYNEALRDEYEEAVDKGQELLF